MDVPAALRILRNAPLEILQQHTSDMMSTLEEVQDRLSLFRHEASEAVDPSGCCVCRRKMFQIRRRKHAQRAALLGPHQSGANPIQSRPIVLFEALIAELPLAWDLINQDLPTNLFAKLQYRRRDRRLDDILRVEDNKKKATPVEKLLRSAAQRSLAIQYSNYQRGKGAKARVDELCDILSDQNAGQKSKLRNGRGGRIAFWVRQNLDYEREKEKDVTQFVNSGIKQLVLEKLLQIRLRSPAQTTNASGFAALTAWAITPFKHLRLDEISSFLDRIFAADVDVPVPAPERSDMSLLDMIGILSPWFGEFLGSYDTGNPARTESSQGSVLPGAQDCPHAPPYLSPERAVDGDHERLQQLGVRTSDRCNTPSPSVEMDENESADIQLSESFGSSRSDVSDLPGSGYQRSTPLSNPSTERGSTGVLSPSAASTPAQPPGYSPILEPPETQHAGSNVSRSTFTTNSARYNQNKRKRDQVEHSDRQSKTWPSQNVPRFDISGLMREENDTSPDAVMQIEPTGADFSEVIEGSQTDIDNMSGAYWLGVLHGGPHRDTSSAEWLQSSIDVSGAAPRLPSTGSTPPNQTNIPAGDFHNGLYTLFDRRYTSGALPNPMLWRLFPPENQPQHSNILSNYPM